MAVPPSPPGTYHIDLTLTDPDGRRVLVDGDLEVQHLDPPPPSVPPTITTEPQGTSVAPGQSATLTVVATGTPPLSYQWFQTGEVVPGATNATYSTGPLTTTTIYAVQVANAVGTALSQTVTVTVTSVIVPTGHIGLTYLRTIGLPPLYMSYAYGDCTGRIVNGKVRLLFTGDWVSEGSPVHEVEVTPDPVATYVQSWYQPYHGKRGTWVTASSLVASADALDRWAVERLLPFLHLAAARLRQLAKSIKTEWYWYDFATSSTPAFNGGHYYHPEHDLLYVTYGDSYNVAGRPDWNCVAIRLHPDGTSEAWGPFRLVCRDGDGALHYGPRAAMNLRQHPTRGTMLGCTSLSSGNVGCPWGANLVGGAAWPTSATPVGPDAPDLMLADRYLYGYYMGLEIDAISGVASGPVRAMRRPHDPYVHEPFPGTTLNFVNPAAYGGVGSWTDNDSLGGFLPLPDRTYFFAGVAGSPVQDPYDARAAHVFYANGANHFTCTHGFAAVPAGITGPTATARFPAACVYANADLERVVAGHATDWQIEPTAWSNLETEFGIQTAPIDSVGNAKMINGGFFDERTRELYLIAQGADRGQVTWGLINAGIHVFRVE